MFHTQGGARAKALVRNVHDLCRVFPEIEYEKVDRVRGMDIAFVTTATTDEEARTLLALMGAPFAK